MEQQKNCLSMLELLNWLVNSFYSRGLQYSQCSGPRYLIGPKFQTTVSRRDGSSLECPERALSCLISSVQTSMRFQITSPGSFLLTNSQHTATWSWLIEMERLSVPNFLNWMLHFGLQTAFTCCLKYLNQNSSSHVNINLHYSKTNATGFILLKRDRGKSIFFYGSLLKHLPR